ncbi:MAG: hypothetical protein ACOCP8_03960 [archaeon]
MDNIKDFIKDKNNVEIIASEIIDTYLPELDKKNIEYQFDINKSGDIKSQNNNTLFQFDAKKDTKLNKLKELLFDYKEDDKLSEEEIEKKYKEIDKDVADFLKKVADKINSNYLDNVKDVIYKYIIPSASPQMVPLENIEIRIIDIVDYSYLNEKSKHLLYIGKKNKNDVPEDTQKQVIQTMYNNIEKSPDKSIKEIFQYEKMTNPLFENIADIQLGDKYLYEINISLFVDYSINKEKALKKIKENQKKH